MLEAIISIVFALIFGVLSILQFAEKGPVLNNSYLYASKEDRAKINKKPLYRQSAICFALISANFVCSAVAIVIRQKWPTYIAFAILGITLVYAIVSSVVQWKKDGI